jgi:AcrR family transcriptional regulator
VEWVAEGPQGEGLRERKKRQMRQQLSDTATEMFVERGFEAVRVAEIAAACGVSEKTVFNYFPTKESLLLDRFDATLAGLRDALADPAIAPVEATVRLLDTELAQLTAWLAGQDDQTKAIDGMRRFRLLIEATPSLRAHQRDMLDELTAVATQALAERSGHGPADPEPQVAAAALLSLWQIQAHALVRYVDGDHTPDQIRAAVNADVTRAAGVLSAGLGTFGAP